MIFVHTLGTALIDVGEHTVRPTSPRKFALLLYLAAERGRRIPRPTLQELIFPDQADKNARHSLRELIHQLRKLGVRMEASREGLDISAADVGSDYSQLTDSEHASPRLIRAAFGGFLPGYSPTHSEAFAEWYEMYRARSISSLCRALLSHLDRARNGGDWPRTEDAARACLAIDPLNEKATFALAEMQFLNGGKAAATQLLENYMDEVGRIHPDLGASAAILRRRISQARESSPARFVRRFVGRAREMTALRTVLAEATSGNSRCVVVSGEPGIGKTRLISELRAISEIEGVRCETVTMHSHDANRPMGAFVDLVPSLLRLPGALGCAPESMEALRRLTSSTPILAPERREQPDLDAVVFAVRAAIVDVCGSITNETPLALIIEDGHSIDEFSLQVLSTLLRCCHESRLLLLISTRDPRRLRRHLRSDEGVMWMSLRPLERDAMDALINDFTAGSVSHDERSRLIDAANGNPLFAISLAEQYRRPRDGDDTPPTLGELLTRRLDPVSHVALGVLATSIALGKHCTTSRLLRAIGIEPIALLEALSELAELGLIDANADYVRPSHPLVADAVNNRLVPAMRRIVSFRVAEVFENDARLLSSPACWWEAGSRWRDVCDTTRSLMAFRECARHAMDIGHAADAARILNEALATPSSDLSTVEAARELILAADVSSDTALVLRGHAILSCAGTEERHDAIELAARRALLRDSQLPEQILDTTLRCLRAKEATPEHRILAATLGLKSIHVAESSGLVAKTIIDEVASTDLASVEDVIRLEFELLVRVLTEDWEAVGIVADDLMRVSEELRPGKRTMLLHNCGIALNLAGKPRAAIRAWERAFHAAGLARSSSHQVRLAAFLAGVYADLYDDENWDAWLSRGVEANDGENVHIENFDLPVMQLCRSFARENPARTQQLLTEAQQQRVFSGSPVRERWGRVFELLSEVGTDPPTAEQEMAAQSLITSPVCGLSAVRDFEIATAATILAARGREFALQLIRDYLASGRRGRQLIDRQLSDTLRRLEAVESADVAVAHPLSV